jgi:hypothetical protein
LQAHFYSWTEHYQAAVLELDPARMRQKAIEAETLIEQRKHELLRGSSPDPDEARAIANALRVLALLKEIANKHS